MLRTLHIIGISALLMGLHACKDIPPKPTADCYVVGGGCDAPCVVEFYSTSINAENHHWDFGNGNTSTLADDTTTYFQGGVYPVTLVVDNGQGDTDTAYREVWVWPQDTLYFNGFKLHNIPTWVNGSEIDPGELPDVFFTLEQQGSVIFDGMDSVKFNVDPANLPLVYPVAPIPIQSKERILLRVWDEDPGANSQEIDSQYIEISELLAEYPSTATSVFIGQDSVLVEFFFGWP